MERVDFRLFVYFCTALLEMHLIIALLKVKTKYPYY